MATPKLHQDELRVAARAPPTPRDKLYGKGWLGWNLIWQRAWSELGWWKMSLPTELDELWFLPNQSGIPLS